MGGCESPKFWKFFFAFASLAVILSLIYSNSLDSGWHLDDFHSITQNPNIHMKEITWVDVSKSFHSDLNYPEKLYRPVAGLTFALNFLISGVDPFSYHLVNLFIHWLAAVFLFLFLYQTLQFPAFHRKYASGGFSIALLSAALWAINPIQTQSVTYIVQRMNALAGMFYILSMACYVQARTAPETKRKVFSWVLCGAAFVLAFGSKENAALLPLSLFLYEGIVVQGGIGSWIRRHKGKVLAGIALILALGALYLHYRRGSFVSSFLGDYGERPFTVVQRLLTEPRVVWFYLSLIFYPLPDRLSIAHSFDVSTSLFNPPSTLFAVLALVGAVVLAVLFNRRYRILSFCLLFFLINHLLESSVFPLELVFEHRNYIPSMVIFLPVVIGLFHVFDRYSSAPVMKSVLTVFIVLLLVGLGHATYLRNSAWKSEETLWADASMKAPDQFRPHHNLGVAYQQQGRLQEAIDEFERALKSEGINRRTEKVVTYYHLGRVYRQLGDLQRAKSFYQEALRLDPNLPQALADLAVVYRAEGDAGKAFTYLERAYRADPESPYVNFNMGLHCMKIRELERAEYHFRKAAKAEGIRGSALLYLGAIFKQKGQLDLAAFYLRASAAANPKDITPHLYLLEVYHASGQKRMALQEGVILSEMMGQDQDLFFQTMDLIMTKGREEDVLLSSDIIIPILHAVMTKRADFFTIQLTYFKNMFDKNSNIE